MSTITQTLLQNGSVIGLRLTGSIVDAVNNIEDKLAAKANTDVVEEINKMVNNQQSQIYTKQSSEEFNKFRVMVTNMLKETDAKVGRDEFIEVRDDVNNMIGTTDEKVNTQQTQIYAINSSITKLTNDLNKFNDVKK